MVTPSLFKDKVFWTAVVDVITALITYFANKYGGGALLDAVTIWGIMQPLFLVVIGYFTVQANNAAKVLIAEAQANADMQLEMFKQTLEHGDEAIQRAAIMSGLKK